MNAHIHLNLPLTEYDENLGSTKVDWVGTPGAVHPGDRPYFRVTFDDGQRGSVTAFLSPAQAVALAEQLDEQCHDHYCAENGPPDSALPTPGEDYSADSNPSYRSAMIDAGRGRQLR